MNQLPKHYIYRFSMILNYVKVKGCIDVKLSIRAMACDLSFITSIRSI